MRARKAFDWFCLGAVAMLIAVALIPREVCSAELKSHKITNDRREVVGDIYDPGPSWRPLQIRDKRGNIVGYIERSGKLTDKRRRKVGGIEDLKGLDYGTERR